MSASKHIIVTGATGLIGKALCRRLMARGDRVTVFTRRPDAARAVLPGAAQYVAWDAATGGAWEATLATADAVVHLAGASIAGRRWTPAYKREILESRTHSTRVWLKPWRTPHSVLQFLCARPASISMDHGAMSRLMRALRQGATSWRKYALHGKAKPAAPQTLAFAR